MDRESGSRRLHYPRPNPSQAKQALEDDQKIFAATPESVAAFFIPHFRYSRYGLLCI